MQENRIPVPKDDRFMQDLIRQIDLLPEPAAFSSEEDARLQENMRLAMFIRKALMKHSRRQVIAAVARNMLSCIVLAVMIFLVTGLSMHSDSKAALFLAEWRYLIASVVSAGVLLLSLLKTDVLRV